MLLNTRGLRFESVRMIHEGSLVHALMYAYENNKEGKGCIGRYPQELIGYKVSEQNKERRVRNFYGEKMRGGEKYSQVSWAYLKNRK